eukprot:CAMPEP_0202441426 /NCGR_PEP_ID=MMETSP1360-20130828/931_1 /ASSEMBLY_ACC=CAM_ASM_000848 /TAXON_ID=515479 /ORGANISM="Licmophora paradoxa, Strain CCMP2313" /LENGTH=167 /DNA_ID=CAMNT_0049056405 /DNA_START=54 /DNA_END=557 /DNA_ORIENTATION=-
MNRSLLLLLLSILPGVIVVHALDLSSGKWKLTEALKDGKSVELPTTRDITAAFRKLSDESSSSKEEEYHVDIRAGNRMMGSIKIADSDDGEKLFSIQLGSLMSTRMMPPAEFRSAEHFMERVFPKLTSLEIVDVDGATAIRLSDGDDDSVTFVQEEEEDAVEQQDEE